MPNLLPATQKVIFAPVYSSLISTGGAITKIFSLDSTEAKAWRALHALRNDLPRIWHVIIRWSLIGC